MVDGSIFVKVEIAYSLSIFNREKKNLSVTLLDKKKIEKIGVTSDISFLS